MDLYQVEDSWVHLFEHVQHQLVNTISISLLLEVSIQINLDLWIY